MVLSSETRMKPGFSPPTRQPSSLFGREGDKTGGFGLYLVAFLFMALILSIMFFFPQYVNMRSGIYRISCQEIRKKVERAVADYDANNTRTIVKPGKRIDLDFLKETGFLGEVQYCPDKGVFTYGPQGEVTCSSHDESASDSKAFPRDTPAPRGK